MSGPAPKPVNPGPTILIGLLIVGLALYGFFGLWKQIQSAGASVTWPTAPGMIHAANLIEHSTRGGTRKSWTLRVRYTYEVNGTEHEGTAIHLGSFPSYGTEAEAREALARHERGAAQVWYNPADPAQAVLEPGTGSVLKSVSLSAFLLLLVLGVGILPVLTGMKGLKAMRARA